MTISITFRKTERVNVYFFSTRDCIYNVHTNFLIYIIYYTKGSCYIIITPEIWAEIARLRNVNSSYYSICVYWPNIVGTPLTRDYYVYII
jgi:hypothetical protein